MINCVTFCLFDLNKEFDETVNLTTLRVFKEFSDTGHFHSSNHQKWVPYQILGGKTVNNVPGQNRRVLSEAVTSILL